MEINASETRGVWWKGALKSGLVGALSGVAIGLAVAGIMFGMATAAPALFSMLGTFVGVGSGFNPITMMAFNGVISAVAGMFHGGSQAVAAYHQQKHNLRDEAKLMELDSRTRALEQVVQPSRHVQKILENGPRHTVNFQTAETERVAEAKAAPTIH
jgi:hypothetical protein